MCNKHIDSYVTNKGTGDGKYLLAEPNAMNTRTDRQSGSSSFTDDDNDEGDRPAHRVYWI